MQNFAQFWDFQYKSFLFKTCWDTLYIKTVFTLEIISPSRFYPAYFIIFQSWNEEEASEEVDENPMPTPIESFLRVFVMSLGIFGDVWEGLEATDHSAQGKVCMFIFLAIAYIMLVNLLIAMMGDTYTKIAEIKNEWMRQVINEFSPLWCPTASSIFLSSIVGKDCAHCRKMYSPRREIAPAKPLFRTNGYRRKSFGIEADHVGMNIEHKIWITCNFDWDSSPFFQMDQLDEIKDIIEMKVSHRKNINRRRDRFGYESNSLIGLDLGSANVIAPDAEDEENPFET